MMDKLMGTRFLMNMGRINGLVALVFSNETLKPTGVLQSTGARADILRSIVVFLHATFEVLLRSHLPKPNRSMAFYSRTDLDKALVQSGIDSKPFQALYPPLTQMAQRRHRIVHDADISKRTDTVSEGWGIVDDWQLIMWLMAVPAFYYQLLISFNAGSAIDRRMHDRLMNAMLRHADFANQLLAFSKQPPELQREALEKALATVNGILATLRPELRATSA
jgi:hypothetical protein